MAGQRVDSFELEVDGERFVVVSLGDPVSRPVAAAEAGAAAGLTPSEAAVAALIVDGRSNAEIARARRTSVRTVANQVASILRKLDVGSRVELAFVLGTGKSESP